MHYERCRSYLTEVGVLEQDAVVLFVDADCVLDSVWLAIPVQNWLLTDFQEEWLAMGLTS